MRQNAQQIRFCKSRDGTRIAYAVNGSGPPLVRAANWISHLDLDRQNPVWQPWLSLFSEKRTLICYDARGCGLSDREQVEFTIDRHVEDLEAVIEAAGVKQFALFGMAGGGTIAVTYAVRHPERVSHLVLHGVPADAKARGDVEHGQAEIQAFKFGWANENPAFRQLFT
jgi:pimeloyl-ACP methyl ester carboxylesterase